MLKSKIILLDITFIALFGLLYWKPFVFNVSEAFNISIPIKKKGFGIDVSHHQGHVNWDTLLASREILPRLDFVFIKATEGIDHIDTEYHYNAKQLQQKNMPVGAYHFFLPNKSSIKQAKNFLSATEQYDFELPPVLDIEKEGSSKKSLLDSLDIWLQYIETNSGRRPIIYCSWSFYKYYFSEYEDYKFWIARYSNSIDFEKDKKIIYWQFSENAQLPYHKTKVDVNVSSVEFN